MIKMLIRSSLLVVPTYSWYVIYLSFVIITVRVVRFASLPIHKYTCSVTAWEGVLVTPSGNSGACSFRYELYKEWIGEYLPCVSYEDGFCSVEVIASCRTECSELMKFSYFLSEFPSFENLLTNEILTHYRTRDRRCRSSRRLSSPRLQSRRTRRSRVCPSLLNSPIHNHGP